MARPQPAAWMNLVGYWLIALPLGFWLCQHTAAGLPGLWMGLCLGLIVVAVGLVILLRLRAGRLLEAALAAS